MAQQRSLETSDVTRVLRSLTEEIGDLRPLGATARMVLRITSEDRFSAHELANAIAADQALTSKMLRLSNSAYYGFARRITTMRDAVVLLGFREVRATTMASCIIETMPMSRHINYETFWHYSVSIGMLAEVLARAERLKTDEAFTAGVVHNIGRLALDQARPALFGEALAYSSSRRVSLHEAQRAVFGFTDAELGSSLAEYWGFPPELNDAVAHYWVDASAQKDPRGLASFVSRARVFARARGSTDGVEPAQEKCDPPVEWSQAPIASSLKVAGGVEGVRQRAGAFMEFAGIR